MWCANCRSDVAAEVSTDNRHVNCAICGGPIATPLSGRTLSRTQQARELLERWSRERTPASAAVAEDSKSHSGTLANRPATGVYAIRAELPASPVSEAEQSPRSATESSKSRHRLDGGPPAAESSARNRGRERGPTAAGDIGVEDLTRSNRPAPRRRDGGHAVAGPHVAFPPKPATKWVSLVGQSLAYIGVLGLMAGTCLVILGYFRGPAAYAPTGWLITMAGQMLLFLGVVTLVSTGMEETTNTVADRIDRLDEKLLRIEQATSRLRGPNSGTDRFATDQDAAVAAPSQREVSRAG